MPCGGEIRQRGHRVDRIPNLESRMSSQEAKMESIRRDLEDMKEREETRRLLQDQRHEQNSLRLSSIEKVLTEIAVYFKLGRLVMNIVWAIGGTAVGLAVAKWAGMRP